MDADQLIAHLGLQPHPEGGYYRQTYVAGEILPAAALPARYDGPRPVATAIYFLLRAGQVSHLHRLASDEVWHHYSGDPLAVRVIEAKGMRRDHCLGGDWPAGQQPQCVVPRGAWFGAELLCCEAGFALVGNTVAPGFDFADFELADRARLSAAFPRHRALIARLAR